MIGEGRIWQAKPVLRGSLERLVSETRLLRSINRFVGLSGLRKRTGAHVYQRDSPARA